MSLKIFSWNVRGLGTPWKRTFVFSHIKKCNPHLICLQETHLVKSSIKLHRPWIQWSLHTTHTSYSHGVSFLVHRSVKWKLGTVQRDPEDRFLFIQAWIDCQPYVLIGLYLPPPAPISILYDAARFAANFPHSRVICMGDFNLLHDCSLDKFSRPYSVLHLGSKS